MSKEMLLMSPRLFDSFRHGFGLSPGRFPPPGPYSDMVFMKNDAEVKCKHT